MSGVPAGRPEPGDPARGTGRAHETPEGDPPEGDPTEADHAARSRIREDLEATLNVVAGAGTGKTRSLLERVEALLEAGARLRDMAIITFTVAAAGELRERLRTELEGRAASAPDDSRWSAALNDLDDAAISTLHAFAQRVLSEHPIEAGLPPGFEVLDEIETDLAFEQWWGDTLDALYGDPRWEALATTLAVLGVTAGRLRRIARRLADHSDRLHRPGRAIATATMVEPSRAEVDQLVTSLAAACRPRGLCAKADSPLLRHLDHVATVAERIREAPDAVAVLAEARLDCRGPSSGRREDWPPGVKAEIVQALDVAEQARRRAVQSVVEPALEALLGFLTERVRLGASARRHDGRVTFQDLLVLARDLVAGDAEVRSDLAARYRWVLLDEFQDTDPLQVELAVRLAAKDPAGAHGGIDWRDIQTRPGALFIVGDPKQSIYRFRRADIEVYHDTQAALGVQPAPLARNHRSRPGVLHWLNAAMSPLFDDDGSRLQVTYEPLVAARPPDPSHPQPVRRVGGRADELDAAGVRVIEAADLAAVARRARAEGWQVLASPHEPGAAPLDPTDPDGEWVRPARFDDIAILVPSRRTLPALEEAFGAVGVPLRIESESLLFSTDEVRDLVSVLSAIDDPIDEVALVSALRSPGFACSDLELLEYAEAGGRFRLFAEPPASLASDHAVVAAIGALEELHDSQLYEPAAETVERVIRERRLLELALEQPRPRDRWRRIRYVADAARAFSDKGEGRLRAFVQWLRDQADAGARVDELLVVDPDDDAVRVLTIHGSKGLEFPIVMLAGLGVPRPAFSEPVVFGPEGPEVRIRLADDCSYATGGFECRFAHEGRAETHEEVRLLYVAATRARDHLVVSLHHRKPDARSLAARLAEVDAATPLPWMPLIEPASSAPEGPERGADSKGSECVEDHNLPADDPAAREAWWARRVALVTAGRGRPILSATGLRATLPGGGATPLGSTGVTDLERVPLGAAQQSDGPAWRRGRAATAVGRAVHAVLQTVDLETGAGLDGAARAQAEAEAVPDLAGTIAALAHSVLDAPIVRSAARRRHWREVPVAAAVDGTVVEGFVDLLVEHDDGLVVVDYKTDAARSAAEIDDALDRYRVQGAVYALALQHALGRSVSRVVFVFARARGAAIERDLLDLPAALRSVRATLAAARAGPGRPDSP